MVKEINFGKLINRDIGKEPILENHTSVCHVSYANGSGGMESSTTLEWKCPNCGWFVGELYSGCGKWHIQRDLSYCARCGQKIDWTLPKLEEKKRYEKNREEERIRVEKETGMRLDNMYERLRKKHGIGE